MPLWDGNNFECRNFDFECVKSAALRAEESEQALRYISALVSLPGAAQAATFLSTIHYSLFLIHFTEPKSFGLRAVCTHGANDLTLRSGFCTMGGR